LDFYFLFSVIISIIFFKIKIYKHHLLVIYSYTIEVFALLILVILFGKNYDFLLLLTQICISFFESIIIILIKNIMEKKFLSPFKVCYSIGIFNFIIYFIILIILSNIKCNSHLHFCKEDETIFGFSLIFNSNYIYIFINFF